MVGVGQDPGQCRSGSRVPAGKTGDALKPRVGSQHLLIKVVHSVHEFPFLEQENHPMLTFEFLLHVHVALLNVDFVNDL